MNHKILAMALSVTGLSAVACGDASEGMCEVTPPDSWEAPQFEANAATALALRAQLDALAVERMRQAEQGMVSLEGAAELMELFEANNPSLASVTTDTYAAITEDAFEEMVEVVTAGPADLVDDAGAFVPGTAGGIFGTEMRGINEGGLEVRQLVDKGLFAGAALYNYALALTEGEIGPATVEAIAALWGANAELDAEGSLTDSANYSHRMGYHAAMRSSLIAAHAYAADANCVAERDAALVTAFRTWEQSMFARFVFYANAAATALGAAAGDDDVAAGLHQLAEGIGLAAGFYGVENPASGPLAQGARRITDAQIESMMDAVGVDLTDLGASTTGSFVSDPAALVEAVGEIESIAAEAFELDAADVEAWRAPTAG